MKVMRNENNINEPHLIILSNEELKVLLQGLAGTILPTHECSEIHNKLLYYFHTGKMEQMEGGSE